jgi:hypothetical protein
VSVDLERFWSEDANLTQCPRAERELIGKNWANRAASELTAGVVFANIEGALRARAVAPEVLALVARAPADEARHAEICRRVASRYLEIEVPFPEPRPVRKPAPRAEQRGITATLLVVLNSCLNESVAMVFLRTCLEQAQSELVRLALRELMREEVDHARIGWAHLASPEVSDAERAVVSQELPRLIGEIRRAWLTDNPSHVPVGHGCLARAGIESVLDEALADLILPGFEHCGVAVPV